MAETQQKRHREESQEAKTFEFDDTNSKRHKSFNNIISILDYEESEEEKPNQDFSAIFKALQQELCFSSTPCTISAEETVLDHNQTTKFRPSSAGGVKESEQEDDDENVRVMRRLLEASDDDLGIPNKVEEEINFEENRQLCDVLWELEDEAANYYTILQSDLFRVDLAFWG